MGGQSGVISQAAQMVNQPQAQQPQYGQPQPMGGNGLIAQAYNQSMGQQPNYANSGTPSYSIGGQTYGGANPTTQDPQISPLQMQQLFGNSNQQMQSNVNQNPMLPNQLAYGEGFNAPSLQSEMNPNIMGRQINRQPMSSMGGFDRPMDGVPSRGFGPMSPNQQMLTQQNVPMSGSPAQVSQTPQQNNFGQNRMQRMENRMQRYQDNGRQIPQGFQRRYDQMTSSQAPQMSEQQRLAKALRGD